MFSLSNGSRAIPVRAPYSIIASTFWAIGHHDGSVPRAVQLRLSLSMVRAYANDAGEKTDPRPSLRKF